MRRLASSSSIVLVGMLALALSGCVAASGPDVRATVVPSTASDAPSTEPSAEPSTASPDDTLIDCGTTSDVRLNQPGREFTLTGTCDSVTVEGQDIEVDAADIGTLVIRGDRNSVDALSITLATVNGTDNSVDAATLDAAEISGERNEIDVDGLLGSLTISGNENEVEANEITDQSVSGDRNEVTVD